MEAHQFQAACRRQLSHGSVGISGKQQENMPDNADPTHEESFLG
jgi:hypothetical protein